MGQGEKQVLWGSNRRERGSRGQKVKNEIEGAGEKAEG